jgi:hypothetical protein
MNCRITRVKRGAACRLQAQSRSPPEELFRVANLVVHEVLEIDIESYIAAVEQALWPFVSVQEPYIAALISVGRAADAMRAASKAERDYLDAVAARDAAVRESDLAFVRRVQGLTR